VSFPYDCTGLVVLQFALGSRQSAAASSPGIDNSCWHVRRRVWGRATNVSPEILHLRYLFRSFGCTRRASGAVLGQLNRIIQRIRLADLAKATRSSGNATWGSRIAAGCPPCGTQLCYQGAISLPQEPNRYSVRRAMTEISTCRFSSRVGKGTFACQTLGTVVHGFQAGGKTECCGVETTKRLSTGRISVLSTVLIESAATGPHHA